MPLSLTAMQALFNDNTAGDISAADGRDVIGALYDWIPPEQKYRMGRLPGETAHADDDFFSTYSGYTEMEVSGNATWAATRGGLTVTFDSQTTSQIAVALKAFTASGPPITIETAWTSTIVSASAPGFGICFADGVTAPDDFAGMGTLVGSADIIECNGAMNGAQNFNAGMSLQRGGLNAQGPMYARFIWKSADTWAWAISPDGETWTDFGDADRSFTMTPTHIGFWVTAWSQTSPQIVSYKYLRVYEADLSV
jgi:hypothetical protein